ncbi:glycine betaine ABC transporter substrate-binding protein [Pontibacillus sp. HMF3514]|uniref:glycine betaine ABC transporter substrate-binding protein n=1 Tax=Pontibacillus sp. HMF3514 TaxID=2692425 RepID=UPI00131F63BF|nr:glycine betaine ABC transporter substrate-binding protein [Pontibacillus sp. HMF3514]QHE51117.1 glycine/betaine ABC transporter substrate-binding protein [Pontibacillus sp. HMF3514]
MKKFSLIGTMVLLIVFSLAACSNSSGGSSGDSKGTIKIGGKGFTEQQILSTMTSIYLKEKGYDVEEASNMGSTVVRKALENGQVDMYWEYTGTALVIFQKQDPLADSEKAYQKVKETDEKEGLMWLEKADLNNTYSILMKEEKAKDLGIKSVSDLADYVNKNPNKLKFASNAEFYARDDGIKGLQEHYGFEFPSKNVVKMDSGLLYNALKDGQVDVSVGFATDGRIKGFNLTALEDDKDFFPAYNVAPVVREEVLNNYPELNDLMNKVSGNLNTEAMMQLNYKVDVEHKEVSLVARNWLKEQGLIE